MCDIVRARCTVLPAACISWSWLFLAEFGSEALSLYIWYKRFVGQQSTSDVRRARQRNGRGERVGVPQLMGSARVLQMRRSLCSKHHQERQDSGSFSSCYQRRTWSRSIDKARLRPFICSCRRGEWRNRWRNSNFVDHPTDATTRRGMWT